MKITAEEQRRIEEDPDYIREPNFGNSLQALCLANPDGVPKSKIARCLGISRSSVDVVLASAIEKIRQAVLRGEISRMPFDEE